MNARPPGTAAFVRVEELLLPAADVQATLFLVAHAPGLVERAARVGLLAASLPALAVGAVTDRRFQRRLSYLHWRGLGQDRVELLAREHHDRFLGRRLRDAGREVVARARAHGHRVVLVTGGLEAAVAPLAAALGADDLVGNRLELQAGVATGKLLEGRGPDWPATYAAAHGLALEGCLAYGCDLEDEATLRAVGHPCAVNPDRPLRRLAEAQGWPILPVR